jgi:alpha-1,3-fucosyltransferase
MNQTVVVVMGQAEYSRLAPPHSYIDALDFSSPKALADYLLDLNSNYTRYLSYFWWQDYYRVQPASVSPKAGAVHFAQAMCRLCERLHTDDAEKIYKNFYEWWVEDSHCGQKRAHLNDQ